MYIRSFDKIIEDQKSRDCWNNCNKQIGHQIAAVVSPKMIFILIVTEREHHNKVNKCRQNYWIQKSYCRRFRIFWKYIMYWSREAPPYHIAMVGLHHPLREPDLHLLMYPALLSLGQ